MTLSAKTLGASSYFIVIDLRVSRKCSVGGNILRAERPGDPTRQPNDPTASIEWVEIEAVFSKAVQEIAWRDLQDDSVWTQGWV